MLINNNTVTQLFNDILFDGLHSTFNQKPSNCFTLTSIICVENGIFKFSLKF